jgi:hypothetical protein
MPPILPRLRAGAGAARGKREASPEREEPAGSRRRFFRERRDPFRETDMTRFMTCRFLPAKALGLAMVLAAAPVFAQTYSNSTLNADGSTTTTTTTTTPPPVVAPPPGSQTSVTVAPDGSRQTTTATTSPWLFGGTVTTYTTTTQAPSGVVTNSWSTTKMNP